MGDLEDAIPKPSETGEVLAATTRALLGQLPALGPIATETLNSLMNAREAERRYEFDAMVVTELNGVRERLDNHEAILEYVASDEFAANVTRTRRVASETAEQSKRRRLAAALANSGEWSAFAESERAQFVRLVEDFDELHIWLLHYFVNPQAWLEAHGLMGQVRHYTMAGVTTALAFALGRPEQEWGDAVKQAAGDLERAGLGAIPLTTSMSLEGMVAPRTSKKGRRFLAFIGEEASASVAPPGRV